tara:strand:- start:36 stop:293 length:258 start_codon:yes stop_codon:yes gene_type:complete
MRKMPHLMQTKKPNKAVQQFNINKLQSTKARECAEKNGGQPHPTANRRNPKKSITPRYHVNQFVNAEKSRSAVDRSNSRAERDSK